MEVSREFKKKKSHLSNIPHWTWEAVPGVFKGPVKTVQRNGRFWEKQTIYLGGRAANVGKRTIAATRPVHRGEKKKKKAIFLKKGGETGSNLVEPEEEDSKTKRKKKKKKEKSGMLSRRQFAGVGEGLMEKIP